MIIPHIDRLNSIRRYRSWLRNHASLDLQGREAGSLDHQARQLHARVYLEKGYLHEHEIRQDGRMKLIADPYYSHSRYFAVTDNNNQVVAAARLIESASSKRHFSFQTFSNLPIFPHEKKAISQMDPRTIVEVSGLVKDRGQHTITTLLLYRTMWQYSLSHGHNVWLMSCDEKLYKRLNLLFGSTIKPIGRTTYFKGHMVVPALVELDLSLDYLLSGDRPGNIFTRGLRRDLARFFLSGIPQQALTRLQHTKYRKLMKRELSS